MRFFFDENFPRSLAGLLTDLGHEVFDIRGTRPAILPGKLPALRSQINRSRNGMGRRDKGLQELPQSWNAVLFRWLEGY